MCDRTNRYELVFLCVFAESITIQSRHLLETSQKKWFLILYLHISPEILPCYGFPNSLNVVFLYILAPPNGCVAFGAVGITINGFHLAQSVVHHPPLVRHVASMQVCANLEQCRCCTSRRCRNSVPWILAGATWFTFVMSPTHGLDASLFIWAADQKEEVRRGYSRVRR